MKESGCDVPAWMLKLPKPKEVKQAERNKRARAAGNEAAAKQAKAAAATKNESIGQ